MASEHWQTPFPDVPRWATVWLPLAVLAAIYVSRFADPGGVFFDRWIKSERGFVENGTVAVLLLAVVFLVFAWRQRSWLPNGRLGTWLVFCVLGCVIFAGEEAAWGQHWFGWDTPEFVTRHYPNAETSFHKLGQFVPNRLPKTILTVGIVVLGLIVPLRMRRKGIEIDPRTSPWYWFLPSVASVPMAWLVVATRVYERALVWTHLYNENLLFRVSLKEINELYIAGFLLVYAWSFRRRLRFAATLWEAARMPIDVKADR